MTDQNLDRAVDQNTSIPIVSRLIDRAIGIIRQNASNDPVFHRKVIIQILSEFNDAQPQYVAELAHLESNGDEGLFNVGVELRHRWLH